MGAVFQFIPGHDFLNNRQQFFLIVDPTGLDGSLAGHSMEHFVPKGGFVLLPAGEQIVCQFFQRSLRATAPTLFRGFPPPTVKGIKTDSAVWRRISVNNFLPSLDAVIS